MRSHFPTAQIKRPAGGPGSCVPVGRNLTNLFRYGIRFYTELEAEAGRPPAGSIKGRSQLPRAGLALAYLETADFETIEGARVEVDTARTLFPAIVSPKNAYDPDGARMRYWSFGGSG